MNIDFNNPGANYAKGARNDVGTVSKKGDSANVAKPETAAAKSSDNVALTEDAQKVQAYTDMIRDTEFEPRMELVNMARERVASGYYNTDEFIGDLAQKLVDTAFE